MLLIHVIYNVVYHYRLASLTKRPLNLTALAVFELSVYLLFSNLLVGELVMIPKW